MNRNGESRALAAVGIGSNLDDPVCNVKTAIDALAGLQRSTLLAASSLYRSAPFGGVEQPDFVNAAVTMRTSLGVRELLVQLQAIERDIGREPGERWGPRIIDLDLLIYGESVIDEPGLVVPHPGIAERNFVLLPLREIVPDLVIPGLGRISELTVDESEPRVSRLEE